MGPDCGPSIRAHRCREAQPPAQQLGFGSQLSHNGLHTTGGIKRLWWPCPRVGRTHVWLKVACAEHQGAPNRNGEANGGHWASEKRGTRTLSSRRRGMGEVA